MQQQGRPRPRCAGGRALPQSSPAPGPGALEAEPWLQGRQGGGSVPRPQQGQHSRSPSLGARPSHPKPLAQQSLCAGRQEARSLSEEQPRGQAQSEQEAAMRDYVSSRRGKGSGQLAVLELETKTRTAPSPPPAGLGASGHTGACSPLLAHRQCGQGPRLLPELTTARLRPRHGHAGTPGPWGLPQASGHASSSG